MQISKKNLSTAQEEAILDQLCAMLAELSSKKETKAFLTTLLSNTEQSVLSKRVAILRLLEQKKSYQEISEHLKVSSATISTVASLRKEPGVKRALKRIAEEEWAENMAEKLGKALPFMMRSANS